MMDAPKHYRIMSSEGQHVATVPPSQVAPTLAFYNERRVLDIDGNPVGAYIAVPHDGFVQGQA